MALTWAPVTYGEHPPTHFPDRANVFAALVRIVECTSATTIRKICETKVDDSQVLQSASHTGATTARPGLESKLGHGALPFWGGAWGPRVSRVHSLLVSLKHKSGNESMGREKWGHSGGQLLRPPWLSQGTVMGRPGSFPSCVASDVFI